MDPKFKVGAAVRLKPQFLDPLGARDYEVIRIVPPDVDGVPAYHLKDRDGQERAARETDLEPASRHAKTFGR